MLAREVLKKIKEDHKEIAYYYEHPPYKEEKSYNGVGIERKLIEDPFTIEDLAKAYDFNERYKINMEEAIIITYHALKSLISSAKAVERLNKEFEQRIRPIIAKQFQGI